MPKLHKGFTLIELLVVIAIIAVLASISIITFAGVQQKGRDGVRKADMRNIQSSLRTYYNDIGGFPDNSGGQISGCGSPPNCSSACTWGSAWTCGTQTYMNRLPKDPSGSDYIYTQGATVDDYTIEACAENVNDPKAVNSGALCTSGKKFVVVP